MFVASNQSFFMGLLFFVSTFFANTSYENKGAKAFLGSRVQRLGIPLLLFFFILSPLTIYLTVRFGRKHADNFHQ